MRDITYPPIIVTAKLGFKALGLRFQLEGTEHVPTSGGVLMAFNHISYVDFILGGFAAHPSRRLVRFMAKRELFDHRWTGPLMRSLHHVSVDRADGLASYDEGVRRLAGVVEAELELRATFDAYAPARELGPRGYDGPGTDLS